MQKILSKLNEEQRQSVCHKNGPCMVLAGPGTGKTTVIVNRLLYLILDQKVNPREILVLTFSKNAALEMEQRFYKASTEKNRGACFGTFHSIFFKLLRKYNGYTLSDFLDDKAKIKILKDSLRKIDPRLAEDFDLISQISNEVSFIENSFIALSDFEPKSCKKKIFDQVYHQYIDYKEEHKKFDFDDMLLDFYEMLQKRPLIRNEIQAMFQHVLVDEFQDINIVQYEIIKILCEKHQSLFVVGDDDQCIYSFRGSFPEIFTRFENYFQNTTIVRLKVNYRSTKNLVWVSQKLIQHNKIRYHKDIVSSGNMLGKPLELRYVADIDAEAKHIGESIKGLLQEQVSKDDIAILYRNNIQSRAIIDVLTKLKIKYHCSDGIGMVFNSWFFYDIQSYLMLSQAFNNHHFIRIVNKPNRYIKRSILDQYEEDAHIVEKILGSKEINNLQSTAIQQLLVDIRKIKGFSPQKAIQYIRKYIGYDQYIREYCNDKGISSNLLIELLDEIQNSACYYTAIADFLCYIEQLRTVHQTYHDGSSESAIKLMTIHKSKGMEFEYVFICGCVDGTIPFSLNELTEGIEEERRLLYVAMTRAKKNLILYIPKSKNGKSQKPSRFIEEINN